MPILLALVLCPAPSAPVPASDQEPRRPPPGLGAGDATAAVAGLGFLSLEAAVPVLYPRELTGAAVAARRRQVAMLEARAFWWNLIGALPDAGVLMVDSPRWTVCAAGPAYGMPATRVWTAEYGLLTLLPLETITTFSEDAAEAVLVAPLACRSRLLAHGLADEAGAAAYTEAWAWILLGESLVETLRIETGSWWQRRLVGSSAAALFLTSPRGRELAPGAAEALDAWTWFWTEYLRPVALDLRTCAAAPPAGDTPASLELDARLFLLGREIWRTSGTACFERYRRAWPVESRFETAAAALDTLRRVMPGLDGWPERLFDPRREEPPPP